jgi:NAD(P)-dependent dehydrogenase (short-subunit alcohol dehydrogenase family)
LLHLWRKSKGLSTAEFEKEFFRNVRPSSLLKRFTMPEEVAAVVAFVCSPGRVSDQRHRPSRRWWGSKIRVLTLGA